MPAPTPFLSVVFDETDVRRLCGEAAFAQADRLQRTGHVLGPELRGNTLVGAVRGTWRRIDRAAATAQSARLEPSCSCGSFWCRHVGALLLHWLRDPTSVLLSSLPAPDASAGGGAIAPDSNKPGPEMAIETPQEELARSLEQHNLAYLREIGRRRNVPASGRSKADLLAQLAVVLPSHESVDGALARLGREERLALDGTYLMQALGPVVPDTITAAYRALGGALPAAPIEPLLDLALLVPGLRHPYAAPTCVVPRAVAARLPTLDGLVLPAEGAGFDREASRHEVAGEAGFSAPRLSIDELLQVVALAVADGALRLQPASPVGPQVAACVPPGWEIDPAHLPKQPELEWYYRQHEVRLQPRPPLVDAADLERLAAQTGQLPAALAFVVHLMGALGLVEGVGRLTVRDDRLHGLVAQSSAARLATLGRAWLAMNDSTELMMTVGSDKPFQLRYRLTYFAGTPPLLSTVEALRKLIARLVGRLRPGTWLDTGSFLAAVLSLAAPSTLGHTAAQGLPAGGRPGSWWLTDRGRSNERLEVGTPAGWQRFAGTVAVACLVGPLTWLGLVDVAPTRSRPQALRIHPMAAVLADREPPEAPKTAVSPLVVAPDLTVLVPAGTSDPAVHALLAQVGVLADVSQAGLRYRVTAERVQSLFDAGGTGPGLIQFLSERAGGMLPEAARATLERWWAGYGAVRLYDELTLIELGDDFLLPELLAASSLGGSLVHTFSPRLIVVESAAAENIIGELTRLGHAPRVVEEA